MSSVARHPAVRDGIPYRRAEAPPRPRGRDVEGVARAPAGFRPPIPHRTQVQACRISHRNGPTGVSRVEADPGNGPGPIRGGARSPCTSGSWNGGSGCSRKYGRSSGREKTRRAFPVARGQQTPVRRGPAIAAPHRVQDRTGWRRSRPGRRSPSPPPKAKAMPQTLTPTVH